MTEQATATAQQQLQLRLLRARKAVEDVASEALKSSQIDETVIGGASSSNNSKHPNITNRHFGDDQTNSDAAANDDEDEYEAYEKERASSAAAFQLGMTLFGDDVTAIERTVQDKLSEVEGEIFALTRDLRSASASADNLNDASTDNNGRDDDDDATAMATMDDATMDRLAQALAAKAAFLKKCSIARSLLDQEEKMALALLSHGSSGSAGASDASGTRSGSSSTSSSSLVESAKLLSQAEGAIQDAEAGLDMAEKAIGAGGIGNGNAPSATAAAADLEAAAKIAASLRAQIRRRRSDLKHRAAAAIDKSVGISREGLTVGASTSSISAKSSSATSVPGGGGTATSATGTTSSIRSKTHDSLADAYDALALLSSGQGLEDAIRLIYSNLYELVLLPLISDHVEAFAAGRSPPTITLHKSESRSAGVGPNRGMTYKLDWTKKQRGSAEEDDVDEIETWCHVLDVTTSILKFVRTHVLLDRSDLSNMLGRYLFGKNPAPPTAAASSSATVSVSALLKAPSVSSAEGASPLLDMMVRAMWDTCLPSMVTLDVLAGLSEMANALLDRIASFESDLVDMELLLVASQGQASSSPSSPIILSPVSDFASNYERRFGEKRRTTILSEGRDILLKSDYHNTTTVGVDIPTKPDPADAPLEFDETDDGMSIFALHKCSVSQVASNLMALCRKTLDEAVDPRSCSTSAAKVALPQQLYRTARELLDLYRAIIPAAHGNEIASVPRTAAILHNDCVFFAHNCLTLGLEYKEKFLASGDVAPTTTRLRQLCTFVDLVPPFRELAERTMGTMIDRQKAQLLQVVGARISILRDALRANESVVEWTDAETALTAGTYHLRHLSQAWRPVLSRDIYSRAMGNLVDTIFSLYLDQVLAAHDISEPAGNFIGELFRNATRNLSELFEEDHVGSAAGSALASTRQSVGESSSIKIAKASLYGEKFDAVGRFMFMSLTDINTGLGDGTFKNVTGQELSKLIVAAFDDSQKRAETLRLLSAADK